MLERLGDMELVKVRVSLALVCRSVEIAFSIRLKGVINCLLSTAIATQDVFSLLLCSLGSFRLVVHEDATFLERAELEVLGGFREQLK